MINAPVTEITLVRMPRTPGGFRREEEEEEEKQRKEGGELRREENCSEVRREQGRRQRWDIEEKEFEKK